MSIARIHAAALPVLACIAFAGSPATLVAADRTQPQVLNYRNGGTGAFPDADPPLEWSNGSSNVVWTWEAPAFDMANSTPIVVGDKLFTLTSPLGLVCLDKRTGKELWRRETHAVAGEDKILAIERWAASHDRLRRLRLMMVRPWETWTETHLQKTIATVDKELTRLGTNAPPTIKQWLGTLRKLEGDAQQNAEAYTAEIKTLESSLPAELYPGSKLDGIKKSPGWSCAAPPHSDGEKVFAIFHPGLLVCYDLNGKRQWAHLVTTPEGGAPAMMWDIGAQAPVAADGKLLIQQGDELQCLEAVSGKVLWRRYHREACSAAGPALGRGGDGEWYYATPVHGIGRLSDGEIVLQGPKREGYFPVTVSPDGTMFHYVECVVRLPTEKGGKCEVLWTLPEEYTRADGGQSTLTHGTSSFCPAVWHGDRLFWNNTAGKFKDVAGQAVLAIFDTKTGALIREPRKDDGVRSVQYPPMILAGRHMFVSEHFGVTHVFTADTEFKRVAKNNLGLGYHFENAYVTLYQQHDFGITFGNMGPVFDGKRMYFRTMTHLYCIGKDGK